MSPALTPLDRLPQLADAISAAPLVAIDTEFHAENRYHPRLCLLQLHVPDHGVHLLDPLDERVLPRLSEALLATPWLLHAGRQDLRVLAPVLGGVPELVFDTQIAAGLTSAVYPIGYAELARDLAQVTLEKSATMSDWTRRPLGDEQLRYAGDDVLHLPRIWEVLLGRLEALGRVDLARQAFADARRQALAPVEIDEAWRDIPQAVHLDAAGRSSLRALAAWREATALEHDQPPRALLADAMLTDLARRRPATVHRILSNRRFPRKVVERHGDQLLACLHGPLAAPPQVEVIAPQTEEDRAAQLLRLAVATHGAAHSWSQRLVMPDPDIDRHVLGGTHPATLGWRGALVGPLLRAFDAGKISVALQGGHVVVRSDP